MMPTVIFSRRFAKSGHRRHFGVEPHPNGWLAFEESDGTIIREISSRNWTRIEGQIAIFALKAESLRDQGWQESDPEPTII